DKAEAPLLQSSSIAAATCASMTAPFSTTRVPKNCAARCRLPEGRSMLPGEPDGDRGSCCTIGSACNDGNPCTDDFVSGSVCVHVNVAGTTPIACDDGNVCNGRET